MSDTQRDYIGHDPKIFYDEEEFLSSHPDLKMLADDYRYCVKNHDNSTGYFKIASYCGAGGTFCKQSYDTETGKLVSVPSSSGPINWGCHARLAELFECGTVVSIWERDGGRLATLSREYIWDMHFERSLAFSSLLRDCSVLVNKKEKRVIATAFHGYNTRPQKLCAMFFIAARQGMKNYCWQVNYGMCKKAGFTPSESFILAAATWGGMSGVPNCNNYSDKSTQGLFKDFYKTFTQDNWNKHWGFSATTSSSLYRFGNDTGDGPVGYGNSSGVSTYPNFKKFVAHAFDTTHANNAKNRPQPSNNVLFCEAKSKMQTQKQAVEWLPPYFRLIKAAALDEKVNKEDVQTVRKFHTEEGGLFI